MHGTELRLFRAKANSPYSYYKSRASDIAAVGTTFNVFSYDAVWPRIEPITSPTPGGCATSYATDAEGGGIYTALLLIITTIQKKLSIQNSDYITLNQTCN